METRILCGMDGYTGVVSEGLNSVETPCVHHIKVVFFVMFQKDLIVWKLVVVCGYSAFP